MLALLEANFRGAPVEKAKAHAEPACEPQLDEEELIDELTEFLHVSGHSDGFGFDLLGWLQPDSDSEPTALCLEVKSTSGGTFHLSRGEWEQAKRLKEQGEGPKYAILVVHRGNGSGPPKRLDLLPNPVYLVDAGQLTKRDDSYELAYRAD
jgi:Protein NO VEIN, C-terminal